MKMYSSDNTSANTSAMTIYHNMSVANASQVAPSNSLYMDEGIPDGMAVMGATVGIIIIALGAFGNVLLILAIVLSKQLCKASNMFVVSLAICDLFQTVMVKPLYVHTYVAGQWLFGSQICKYVMFASNITILESILHVSAIALFRYVIIVHPKAARCFQTRRAIILVMTLMYLLPLLILVAPNIPRLSKNSVMGEDIYFNKHIMFCSFIRESGGSFWRLIRKVAFLTVAGVFLLYCYIRIYHAVRSSGQSINITGAYSPSRIKREITLLKTVIVVFLTFCVSYLPITMLYSFDANRQLPYMAYFVGVILLWLSPSVNWLIYGIMNRQYAQAYRYLLCGTAPPTIPTTNENGSAVSRWSYQMSLREEMARRATKNNTNQKVLTEEQEDCLCED